MGMALRKFSEAVDITPEMANCFITLLKNLKIEFYVAPYEADAQLAHLFITGRVSAVITEDSDLLPYGVKKCFFKMDRYGNGIEVDLNLLHEVTEFDFSKFDSEMLLTTCILSGCDYLESIKGIGFKKAYKLVYEVGDNI
jgi:exonuclease 1